MTPADLTDVARLRKLQSKLRLGLNAVAYRISDNGDVRPSAEQWAELWPALEAATVTLQALVDQLAAAQIKAKAHRHRHDDVAAADLDTVDVP